jgi:hypothetical protein
MFNPRKASTLALLIAATILLCVATLAGPSTPDTVAQGLDPQLPDPPLRSLKPASLAAASPVIAWEYDQLRPAVAYSSQADRYLVVWEDHHWGWGDDWDIYGRFVRADGVPSGAAFGISWEGSQHRLAPAVAYNAANGEFLVVWEHEYSPDDHDIRARRVAADATLIGEELVISNLLNSESSPAVAYSTATNEYLIVWEHLFEARRHGIYGRRVSASGTRLGEPIAIDTSSLLASALVPYDALAPAVAYGSASGPYLVVWQDKSPEKADYDITARRVGNDGSLVGNEILISTWENDQLKPRLAFNGAANQFLVVWEDHHWGWGEDWDIYGQRVNANGTLASGNFGISWEEANHRENPALAYHPAANDYLVAWEYEFSATDHDVWQRRVASDGTLPDGEVAVSRLGSWEGRPALASDAHDGVLIVWEDGRDAETNGLDLWVDLVRLPTATPTPSPTATRTPTRTGVPTASRTPTPSPTATRPLDCPDLLVNGDFESGTLSPWRGSGAVTLGPGRESTFGAAMLAEGTASAGLSQDVSLPAPANPAWLDFWWLADSGMEQPEDRLIVYAIEEGLATQLRTLHAVSPLGLWQHEVIDLTPFAGLLREVAFTAYGDAELPTTFLLDDIHLFACGVPTTTPTATPTRTATPTATRSATPIATPTLPAGPLPDLVITDIWNEGRLICYQVRNAGRAAASRGHESALFVDGAFRASHHVEPDLQPGARWSGCFDYAWECSEGEDHIIVEADHNNSVAESDETNNRREELWKCDTTPPEIVGGPRVLEVTHHSATISWETDEDSDSVVRYGQGARVYTLEAAEPALWTEHAITLMELEPSTTYHFLVQSTDASGNSVASRDAVFQTLPLPDDLDPSVSLVDPGPCQETVTITAAASDNTAVERVEFYLNDVLVFIDYAPPYNLELDTTPFANGRYSIAAKAFDLLGRSALDDRAIDIANLVDFLDPEVNIYHPSDGATVSGDQRILVLINDDTGVSKIEFLVNNTTLSAFNYPTTPTSVEFSVSSPYWWNTEYFANGAYTVTVRATDASGKTGQDTVNVTVNNTGSPLRPKLVVTKHQVTRHKNYFGIDLWIANQGGALATNIEIEDALKAFQPLARLDAANSVEYSAEFSPSSSVASAVISDTRSLGPGQSRYYTFKAVPVMVHPNPPTPSIGDSIELSYQGPYGTEYSETTSFTILKTTLNYPDVSIPTAHSDALKEANYLIVTNPHRIYGSIALALVLGADVGPVLDDANDLLATMAHLAQLKNGVLGYYTTYTGAALRSLTVPGGAWAKVLHPSFSTSLGGYMLIVGETEIVPAFGYPQPGTGPIHHSDQPFSDTTGNDDQPELIVGRIIGNTYKDLAHAIQTSINIDEPTPGYGFDRSHALVVAGGCGGENDWQVDADEKVAILDDQFSVSEILCLDYFDLSSFNAGFSQNDGFAAGHVTGDAKAEVVIGDVATDKIHIYAGNGTKLKDFDCGYGGKEFAAGDKLAVANGNIVMADHSADRILYYTWGGILQDSFSFAFDVGDGLATGDVTGDAYEDIIIADASADKVYVYKIDGVKLGEFPCTYGAQDALAVGNALGHAKSQILRANANTGFVHVYDGSGSLKWTFDADFTAGDGFAVGDVLGDSKAEVLTADGGSGRIHIYIFWVDPKGEKPSKFTQTLFYEAGFASNDGFALGDVQANARSEVMVARHASGAVYLSEPTCSGKLLAPFKSQAADKDVIFFTGHGNPSGWCDVLQVSDSPFNFGSTNPFIYGATCSSGNYSGNNDDSIGEAFFDSGASIYVGATIPSYDGPPSKKFYQNWVNTSKSIGSAFAQTERDVIATLKDYYWVREYNLYGDPKIGATSGAPGLPGSSQPLLTSEPPSSLEVVVPDYQVTHRDGWDYVEIPDGILLLVEDQPQIPIYSVRLDVPSGYEIQDVLLTERSGLTTVTGLNIPTTSLIEKDGQGQELAASTSWYPEPVYDWRSYQNPDGTADLVITVYPFYYNPLTTDVQFYQRYHFHIAYTASTVAVTALHTDQDAYPQGAPVVVDLGLENTGEAQDVIVSAAVKRCGSHEVVAGLLLRTLHHLVGPASFSLHWDSTGFEPDDYYVEATLQAEDGHVLDVQTAMFRLGLVSGEITEISTTPAHFEIGDSIHISLAFHNTGTVDISGTALIQVQDMHGETIQQFEHDVVDLAPGSPIHFEDVWDTSSEPEGTYTILGYVLYDSMTSEPGVAVVSTSWVEHRLYLPVITKSYRVAGSDEFVR